MATQDTVVTICPWFRVHEGKMDAFKALCERFVAVLACITDPVTTLRPFGLQPVVEHSLFDHAQRFQFVTILVH